MPALRLRICSAIAVAALAAGCSLLLDVEPDCDTVSNCVPYVCNAENTACLTDCVGDTDCAAGFACSRTGNACIPKGCTAVTEPISLFGLPGPGFEYDVDRVGDSLWAIAVSADQVGLAEVSLDGRVLVGSNELVLLEDAPELPATPIAVSTGDGINVLWRGEPGTNVNDIRFFRLGTNGETSGPRVLYRGAIGQNIDTPSAAFVDGEMVLAWATFLDRSQIEVVRLNADGTFGEEDAEMVPTSAPIAVTDRATGSTLPAVAASSDAGAIARRESAGGQNSVVASFIDSELQLSGDLVLSEVSNDPMESIAAAGMDEGVAVVWLESQDEGRSVFRSVIGESQTIKAGTRTNDFTLNPSAVAVAAGADEFAVAWIAVGDLVEDVFVRRFDEAGEPLFVTFGVTGGTATDPGQPRLVRNEDGYGVFWVEFGASPPELFYRRYTCLR